MHNGALKVGSDVIYDGEGWAVEAFIGADIRLRSLQGKVAVVSIAALVGSPDFGMRRNSPARADSVVTFPENISEHARASALKLLEHINEMQTGFKSGNLATALNDEPRPAYDTAETTLKRRVEAKARETGMATRTLWSLKAAYLAGGIWGLIDQRHVKPKRSKIDQRVISGLHHVVRTLVDESNITNQSLIRRVARHLKENFPDEEIHLPPTTTFNRLIARETKNESLKGSAKNRRSINNRPATTYRSFFSTRPGEMVLIDSTPLDAFAMDPVSFEWVPIQLTIAVDLYTRSIVGWRFTPWSTKQVDAALLLYDIIRPKTMLKGWPETARWTYIGVPEHVVINIAPDLESAQIAGIPILRPDTIVVDHGKVFVSQAFKDACTRIGISLQLARPYTPTDKAHVERIFRTIRENFVMELPGYKGPDIFSRGKDVESNAFYFIHEIDALFAGWVANWWQRRQHQGLDIPDLPHLKLSPNDMYNEGIARAGFVHVVTDENLYYELLPTVWRTVQHYGVEVRGLRYDGDILNDFRDKQSPYGGVQSGKWPLRYDARDLSCLFFFDPVLNKWHRLDWRHGFGASRPFNEATLGYAKSLVITREGNPGNADELAETLNELLDSMQVSSEDKRERKRRAINAMHAEGVGRDRPKSASSLLPPDEEADLTLSGPIFGERSTLVLPRDAAEPPTKPLQSIDEAMENDDDELDF